MQMSGKKMGGWKRKANLILKALWRLGSLPRLKQVACPNGSADKQETHTQWENNWSSETSFFKSIVAWLLKPLLSRKFKVYSNTIHMCMCRCIYCICISDHVIKNIKLGGVSLIHTICRICVNLISVRSFIEDQVLVSNRKRDQLLSISPYHNCSGVCALKPCLVWRF